MSDEDDPYAMSIELRHPNRPTVKIGLSWPEEQDKGTLT